MRFQRIFWVLFFLFPNSVLANDADLSAKQSEVETLLGKNIETITATPSVGEIQPAATNAQKTATEFTSASKRAQTMCLESTSPAISSFLINNGLTLQTLGTMASGFADDCSNAGKMIGLASAAVGAFQAQCGTFQGLCESKATELSKSATEYLAASEKAYAMYSTNPSTQTQAAAAKNHTTNATNLKKTAGDASILCGKYKMQTEKAVTAGVLALGELIKSNKCAEETAATNGIDCNDKNNIMYNQKNCMCTRNELPAAECQNILIGNGMAATGPEIAIGKADGKLEGDGSLGDLGGTQTLGAMTPSGSAGAGLPGAPTGGGGGVGASGGGGGGAQDGSPSTRRLNTNILGGGSGGGGGGGFGSGPGYGETDPSLKAYGPGGAKDANRVVASEVAKQVTNPAGRSNWEKVKSRYTDNLRNLTGR